MQTVAFCGLFSLLLFKIILEQHFHFTKIIYNILKFMSLLDLTHEYDLMTFTGKMASLKLTGDFFFFFWILSLEWKFLNNYCFEVK